MSDYSKWKVTDLKAELKRRGIAQTGLRVKQQFIDKLVEEDANGEGQSASEEPAAAEDEAQDEPQPAEEDQPAQEQPASDAVAQSPKPEAEEPEPEQKPQDEAQDEPRAPPTEEKPTEASSADEKTAEEQPQQSVEASIDQSAQQPQKEESTQEVPEKSQATDFGETKPTETAVPPAQTETEASAPQPVEQAPGDVESAEKPESAEAVASSVPQLSGPSTGLSTPIAPEEVMEDRRKRKRRSQSPIPTPEALANKKMKAQEEEPQVVLPEDKNAMDVDEDTKQEAPVTVSQDNQEDRNHDEIPHEDKAVPAQDESRDAPISEDSQGKKGAPAKHDVRFKGLFAATEPEQARPASPPADAEMEDAAAEPAQHVATAALYVDGLMRPLQPAALRNHLVSIASPPGASPNPDVITEFFLDPIKTHCFVGFTNVSTASRARAALHGTVWPNERNRKNLFVDFIPENKLQEWITTEEESRRRGGPPPRFEVKYDRTDDGVVAVLEEIDPKSAGSQSQRRPEQSDFSRPPPLGPRAEMGDKNRRPSGPPPPAETSSRPGQGFKPLDELFMSTTAKPKLYYLPVPREVADRRLDRFDDLLRKGSYPRRGGDETRRITFEDGDLFVDNGPEYGGRNRRGGGRGRGRGGGFGDSWRGDRRGGRF